MLQFSTRAGLASVHQFTHVLRQFEVRPLSKVSEVGQFAARSRSRLRLYHRHLERAGVPESIQRFLKTLKQPAYVTGRRWDVLAWNASLVAGARSSRHRVGTKVPASSQQGALCSSNMGAFGAMTIRC
jgi:hypothetical protein